MARQELKNFLLKAMHDDDKEGPRVPVLSQARTCHSKPEFAVRSELTLILVQYQIVILGSQKLEQFSIFQHSAHS